MKTIGNILCHVSWGTMRFLILSHVSKGRSTLCVLRTSCFHVSYNFVNSVYDFFTTIFFEKTDSRCFAT